MRFVLAAALAVSFATAAIAAPVKSAPAEVTKQVSTAHCWICKPADLK